MTEAVSLSELLQSSHIVNPLQYRKGGWFMPWISTDDLDFLSTFLVWDYCTVRSFRALVALERDTDIVISRDTDWVYRTKWFRLSVTSTVLSHLSRPRLKWFYRFSFRKSRLKWESTYVGEMLLVFLFTNLGFSLKNIIIHCVFSIFRACGGQKVDLSGSRLKWETFC